MLQLLLYIHRIYKLTPVSMSSPPPPNNKKPLDITSLPTSNNHKIGRVERHFVMCVTSKKKVYQLSIADGGAYTSLSARSWKKGSIRRRVCVRWPVVVGPRFLIITTTKDIARDSGQQYQQQNSPFFLPFSHIRRRRRDGWLSRKHRVSRSPSTTHTQRKSLYTHKG